MVTAKVDGRRGKENGHNVMQIAGAEGIITDGCDNEKKNTNREGAESRGREEQGRGGQEEGRRKIRQ